MDKTILKLYEKKIITRETALDYSFDRKEMVNKIARIGK